MAIGTVLSADSTAWLDCLAINVWSMSTRVAALRRNGTITVISRGASLGRARLDGRHDLFDQD